MSNSSLASINVPAYHRNYAKGRDGRKIEKITIHHMAGVLTAKRCGELFQNPDKWTSSNYGIGNDGTIALYVDEANTSYCDTNWDSNCKSVTIEVSNSTTIGWKVSDKALNSLIKLVADIGKRNNLGTLVKGKNVTWHSMYAATSCPGPYLLSKMDYIVAEANKINNPPKEETTTPIKKGDIVKISSDATYYNSTMKVPLWVRLMKWVVEKVEGNRVVIDKSENGKNSINSPIDAKYLTVVKTTTEETKPAFAPYMVKITAASLNVRKGAGTNYSIVATVKKDQVYTIVEEANGTGAKKWGKLKSGVGWISLDYVKKA